MKKRALITGSAGLIGSEAVRFFCSLGFEVIGIDNNMRAYFFGDEASTDWNRKLLETQYKNYIHYNIDIRNEKDINDLFKKYKFDLIIHAAAQPSHDWAAKEPLTDFSVNATGTLILLEAFKNYCPEAVFIFTSTNKVYGDTPNFLPLVELDTRYEIDPSHKYKNGIDETMNIDDSKHSIFGASKVAADVLVQEYGRYFDLHTGVFRGGCLTGPAHSGTELHGFLAYLVKCIAEGRKYTIFGYKGKQVRDNIHSSDLISMFYEFYKKPRIAEVYNAGGSRHSNVSMMEAIEKIEDFFGRKGNIGYSEQNRSGDHIWYVSDVGKFKKHYPEWEYKYDIDAILEEICTMGHFEKPEVSSVVVSGLNIGKESSVFVASHITETAGPVQALKSFLVKNFSSFTFVEHPFSYTSITGSSFGSFRGSLLSKFSTVEKPTSELWSYFKDLYLSMYWYIKSGRSSRYFIGVDALNSFAGVLLKLLGFRFDLIYYAVDYSPVRFKNPILNSIYHLIDKANVKSANSVWVTSERALEARKEKFEDLDNKFALVENGIYLNKVHSQPTSRKDKNVLVVVDHLTQEKGIQNIISSMKSVLKLNKKARLVIYGSGPYEQDLKALAKKRKVEDVVEFRGALSPDEYLEEIGGYGIGLCLHKGNSSTGVYYSDPVSPKEMLASGLPVIVSKSLGISVTVEKKQLGIAVTGSKQSIVSALKDLWGDDTRYKKISANGKRYAKTLGWDAQYKKGFDAAGALRDKKKLRDLKIGVATHEYFKGSGQELRDYLVNKKIFRQVYVAHLFYYAKDSVSYLKEYVGGKLTREAQSPQLPKSEYLLYLRDALFNMWSFLTTKEKLDYFIGIDSFNAIFGLILKRLGKVDKVVFMTIDYIMHNRVGLAPINWLYVKMDRIAFFNSDFTWNVSDRMSRQRVKELGKPAEKKTQLVVPIGVPIDEAEKIKVKKKNNILVYSGSLGPEFGLELLIESMPELTKEFPDLELRIIGDGVLRPKLEEMVEELNVSANVNFVGYINTNTDREKWLRLLKESTLGLATYADDDKSYKQFSDVTKPKDYMSCGLPIITTSVIPLSEDIKKHNLGRVVQYNKTSFVKEISSLLRDKKELKQIEKNVYTFSKEMTWENIFDRVFMEMGITDVE